MLRLVLLTLATFQVAARRLWANRRLSGGLLVGFTVAVAAAASLPAYTTGALQRVLQTELASDIERTASGLHLAHIERPERPTSATDFATADQFVQEQGLTMLDLTPEVVVRYGALDPVRARPVDPTKIDQDRERWLSLAFQSDLNQHITVVDGRLPAPGKTADDFYEVLVEEEALDRHDFAVGAEFWVPVGTSDLAAVVGVRVIGVFERTDPLHAYWFQKKPFEQAFFVSEEVFRTDLINLDGMAANQYSWYFGLNPADLKMTDALRLLIAMYEIEGRAAQLLPDTELLGGPMELLTRFLLRAEELQLMMLLLTAPTLMVVAYFIMVTSGMIVDRQRQEIAVMRSRGAGISQVVGIYLLEGVLFAGGAMAIGYPLALLLSRAMGAAVGFLQFVDRKQPPLLVPYQFWLFGAVAGVVGIFAYVLPALSAARQSIVAYKQESARRGRSPAWSRFGLDFICLTLAGYAYYILSGQEVQGGALIEPINLLAPTLFVLGAGLLVLRLLPLVASLVARLAEPWANGPLYLTLTQMSRAPSSYVPVVLLLTLTVGMGLYGAVTARTFERNVEDRIEYNGGADVVLEEAWEFITDDGLDPTSIEAAGQGEFAAPPWDVHYSLPGVAQPARVRTQQITSALGGRAQRKGTLMAIDPTDFGKVSSLRRDLLPQHINTYLNLLALEEESVLVSQDFLVRNNLVPGDRVSLVAEGGQEISLVIQASIAYWPGLDPLHGDFFVANLGLVEEYLGLQPYTVWMRMEPDAKLTPVVEALKSQGIGTIGATDYRQRLIMARRDPQLGGLLGGLTNGFLLAAAITVMGFWLYAALSARSRALQFGVLRALGLTSGQLGSAVILEQVLTVVIGVGAGTGLGLTAAQLFIPMLQKSSGLSGQTPPFLIVADPTDRIRLYAVLLLMLLIGVVGLMNALGRLRIYEAVKLGEDG